jgi:hypothetical protein
LKFLKRSEGDIDSLDDDRDVAERGS